MMENEIETTMEHNMETGIIWWIIWSGFLTITRPVWGVHGGLFWGPLCVETTHRFRRTVVLNPSEDEYPAPLHREIPKA